jgi:hypothetical protein
LVSKWKNRFHKEVQEVQGSGGSKLNFLINEHYEPLTSCPFDAEELLNLEL